MRDAGEEGGRGSGVIANGGEVSVVSPTTASHSAGVGISARAWRRRASHAAPVGALAGLRERAAGAKARGALAGAGRPAAPMPEPASIAMGWAAGWLVGWRCMGVGLGGEPMGRGVGMGAGLDRTGYGWSRMTAISLRMSQTMGRGRVRMVRE